jgi:cyclopropane-fatty-acyl-phospholipid synthase
MTDIQATGGRMRSRAYPYTVRKAIEFAAHLERGRLDVTMPDGEVFQFAGPLPGPHATMLIRDFAFARSMAGGDIGIAESYLRGEWESPDLTRFLELFCVNQPMITRLLEGRPVVRLLQMLRHWTRPNTKRGSQHNIHAHYDLGNAFYSHWLDSTMTYSSALDLASDGQLEAGQSRKYAALADALALAPGQHVLEIGCGWGGFARYAATERHCKVTALTISREQYDFVQARIAHEGLGDRIEARYQDYRDERGLYDRIVSIEMFEAVGESWWPTYFRQLRERLTDGGRAGLQVITIDEQLFPRYRRELDFIRRYIFPGGMLPTGNILEKLGSAEGLRLSADRAFGADYALTLAAWRSRFRASWPAITTLGFDERFRRLWEYYLSYCEAGFRAGTIDVRQVIFAKA